jgi:hypothetical protein
MDFSLTLFTMNRWFYFSFDALQITPFITFLFTISLSLNFTCIQVLLLAPSHALDQRFLTFWILRTPTESLLEAADPLAIYTIWTSKQYTKNTQQTNKLWNILFNSQTKKYTKIGILILMGRLTNRIFNLQFQIHSLLQSFLKFSISDFDFLLTYILY